MPSAYKRRPCRRCGGDKGPKQKTYVFGDTWYCRSCIEQRNAVRVASACGSFDSAHMAWSCFECRRIRAAKMRESALRGAAKRKTNFRDYSRPEHWNRYWCGKAHSMVRSAIKQGILPALDGSIACVDCGVPANEYDHRDYGRPLDVQPVCRCCNKSRGTAIWPSKEQFHFARVAQSEIKEKAA